MVSYQSQAFLIPSSCSLQLITWVLAVKQRRGLTGALLEHADHSRTRLFSLSISLLSHQLMGLVSLPWRPVTYIVGCALAVQDIRSWLNGGGIATAACLGCGVRV